MVPSMKVIALIVFSGLTYAQVPHALDHPHGDLGDPFITSYDYYDYGDSFDLSSAGGSHPQPEMLPSPAALAHPDPGIVDDVMATFSNVLSPSTAAKEAVDTEDRDIQTGTLSQSAFHCKMAWHYGLLFSRLIICRQPPDSVAGPDAERQRLLLRHSGDHRCGLGQCGFLPRQ